MHLQAKIATRPIRVLKVGKPIDDGFIRGGFMSITYPKLYLPNVVCKQRPLEPYIDGVYFKYSCYLNIERGFHSYRHTSGYAEIAAMNLGKSQYCIGIFEIPTGSTYYYDNGYYVSDAIKLLKAVNTKKEWEKINFRPEQILL